MTNNSVFYTGEKVESFLEKLCNSGLIRFDRNSSLYQVHPSAHRDAVVLCEEGHVQGEIARAIAELVI